MITLDDLRRHALARTLFSPTTLPQAVQRLGFVQADPIRAPARAQDLTLRQRVREAAAHDIDPEHAHDALLDVVLATYAPLPERSLSELASHLVLGAPQWRDRRRDALQRLLGRACQAQVDGLRWIWPAGENPASRRHRIDDRLRLLAPFDPVVWDRRRFELFWGWAYRFEAYTPAHKRVRGHYALPLLWQGRVDGWGNLSVEHGRLQARIGWHAGRPPADPGWRTELDAELSRCALFLGLDAGAFAWRTQAV